MILFYGIEDVFLKWHIRDDYEYELDFTEDVSWLYVSECPQFLSVS